MEPFLMLIPGTVPALMVGIQISKSSDHMICLSVENEVRKEKSFWKSHKDCLGRFCQYRLRYRKMIKKKKYIS